MAGGVLIASGIFHIFVWLVVGGSLSGDISWRKPILFGVSAGVTLLSLSWVANKLPRRRRDPISLGALGLAMLVEVGLITIQQWRGVASHFNRSTSFDATVLLGIEILIILVTLVILDLTIRCFGRIDAHADNRLAIRGGMALMAFACLLGFVLVGYGNRQQTLGQPPGIYGDAGVMKFPHGMPIHAIQYLPMIAWSLKRLGANERQRHQAVGWTLASVIAFTLFSLLQTFTGRARFDIWWLSGLSLIASFVFLSVPVVQIARHFVDSVQQRKNERRFLSGQKRAEVSNHPE